MVTGEALSYCHPAHSSRRKAPMMRPLLALAVVALLIPGCNCGAGQGPDGGGVGGGAGGGDAAQDAGSPCGISLDDTAAATLYVTADDEATVYINGTYVASQAVPWSSNALERTIQVNRNPTRPNVVAVLAFNRQNLGTRTVDRGMLLDFRLGDAGDTRAPRIFASGAGWKVLNAGQDAGLPELADGGWTRLDFDDSQWARGVAELPYGSAPYGSTFSKFGIDSAGASWMWAYDSASVDPATKPLNEAVYFRQVFYFSVDGGFSPSAATCP